MFLISQSNIFVVVDKESVSEIMMEARRSQVVNRVEVRLDSQDYTLTEIKRLAIIQARELLGRVAAHDSENLQ